MYRRTTAWVRSLLGIVVIGLLAMIAPLAAPLAHADDAHPAQGKHYVIGTDTTFAPFEMRDPKTGQMVGIDMDLIRAIAEKQGFTIDIKSLGFDAAVQALKAGQVDAVMAGMSITDERKKTLDFTDGYFESGLQVAVAEGSSIASLDDLKGKKVAVKNGTAGADYAKSIAAQYGFTTTSFSDTSNMINDVKVGNSAAFIDDYPVVLYGIQQGSGMQVVGDKVKGNSYGVAVQKGQDAELVQAFNLGLAEMKSDGSYDSLVGKYLGTGLAVANETDKPAQGKHYVIGTDTTFAPFEMRDPKTGEMVGIDMDLIRAIAKDQGFTIDIKSLGFDAAVQALKAGQVDAVMAGMSITDERKKTLDFTDGYFESGLQVAVAEGSSIASLDDLKGKKVAVKNGTAGADYAKSIAAQYGFTTTSFSDTSNMINDVKVGNSAAFIDDYPVVLYGIQQGSGMQVVGDKVKGNSYGVAVTKGQHPELVQAFNIGLNNLKASGQYQTINETYLGSTATQRDGFWQVLRQSLPSMLRGLGTTVLATACALLGATVLGLVFGMFKVGGNRVLRFLANTYVNIFRGTPLLVQLFFIYFTVPPLLTKLVGHHVGLGAFTAGVLALGLNAGAYMTEIVRGGIQSVDPGQLEAARSLGLSYGTSMRKVVVPQAVKIATPSFINQFIITLKDTSLVAVIGLAELTYQGQQIIATNLRSELWFVIGLLYFIVIMALTWLSNLVDRKVNK